MYIGVGTIVSIIVVVVLVRMVMGRRQSHPVPRSGERKGGRPELPPRSASGTRPDRIQF